MSQEFDDVMREMTARETFAPYLRALEIANRYRDQAERYLSYARVMELQACFISEIEAGCPAEAILYMSEFGSPCLTIYLNVKGFLCDAAPELMKLLEFLSIWYENPPTSLDSPASACRFYNFTPGHPDGLPIQVSATLAEGSDLCQRVVTGTRKTTKLVEVETDEPVFAFKC